MKKIPVFILCIILCLSSLTGCGSKESKKIPLDEKDDKLKIVTTVFPVYDWIMGIVGENNEDVDVTLLSDSGTDLHNFNPTADDFVKIWDSDLFVYIGGLSENWANEASRGRDGEELK
nr:zinc ABC transporter substrate-binding protein [Lachnospiraceae bacterium]